MVIRDTVRLIVLGTGDVTVRFIEKVKNIAKIELLGNIPDYSLDEDVIAEYNKKIKELGCDLLCFNESVLKSTDVVFSIEYRRVIPADYVNNYLFINCHGGILPKWRGFACNAWAIINGESEIGYSIHEMNEKLDDGKLFFVKRIPINTDQTYSDVHDIMVNSIINETPDILVDIANGKREGKSQEGSFCYCNKFSAKMGNLCNFDKATSDIINLYRCMAKPLGTGVYFTFKGVKYEVGKVEDASRYGLRVYIGIPGKVINITRDSLWVKTNDSGVILSDVTIENKRIDLMHFFRNGSLLG